MQQRRRSGAITRGAVGSAAEARGTRGVACIALRRADHLLSRGELAYRAAEEGACARVKRAAL